MGQIFYLRLMKILLLSLTLLPIFSFSQSTLDQANGYKIFKLGTPVSLYKGKLKLAERKGNDASYFVVNHDLLIAGNIKINVIVITTFKDTLRTIALLTDSDNGELLGKAFVDKFGKPDNSDSEDVRTGLLWTGKKVSLHFKMQESGFGAVFMDQAFVLRRQKEKATENASGL